MTRNGPDPIIEPVVAMAAAIEQLRTGGLEEIELTFNEECDEYSLTMAIEMRRISRYSSHPSQSRGTTK